MYKVKIKNKKLKCKKKDSSLLRINAESLRMTNKHNIETGRELNGCQGIHSTLALKSQEKLSFRTE